MALKRSRETGRPAAFLEEIVAHTRTHASRTGRPHEPVQVSMRLQPVLYDPLAGINRAWHGVTWSIRDDTATIAGVERCWDELARLIQAVGTRQVLAFLKTHTTEPVR